MRNNRKKLAILGGVLAVLAGWGVYTLLSHVAGGADRTRYLTASMTRGDIQQSVSATGTINPVKVVNVGTQVSAVISKIYADYNAKVEEGELLAQLDTSLFDTAVQQSQASLANAEASLRLASLNRERARTLFAQRYVAKADVDKAEQEFATAQALVTQAKAQVDRDKVNLSYCEIRSPVSGIVISRDVDVGQTVAASFQTPTLFKIAQDLRQMQIDTSLSEADIGQVKEGSPVTFTVDAYPGKRFDGVIKQIRLNPSNQQNVVTYNVVVTVDNADLSLLPGMTAFVEIIVADKKNVFRVPNAAFRFKPEGVSPPASDAEGVRTVYVLKEGQPAPARVATGVKNAQFTEVTAGELAADSLIIIGDATPQKDEDKPDKDSEEE